MSLSPIFGPMFVMFGLTLVVWLYMYARRLPFILGNDLQPDQLRPHVFAELQPPGVANPSDNLKNLFELPVIFYALVLYLESQGQVDSAHVVCAWLFALFRILHSLMHCTLNIVPVRFLLYLIAAAALWVMVLRAAVTQFSG